ncbi:MAG: hypothetical protein ABI282_00980, partial [Candidatus Baltobacteraceae bacterium]
MTSRFAQLVLCATIISGCGGGGSGNAADPMPSTTPASAPTPGSPAERTTNASGTVVDDQTGAPLRGERVVLMPWGPCAPTPAPTAITPESDGCPTPLPAPQATTGASGQFALANAPDGHYVLIVGNDTVSTPPPGYAPPAPCGGSCPTPTAAPFTVQATVHDNVILTGG